MTYARDDQVRRGDKVQDDCSTNDRRHDEYLRAGHSGTLVNWAATVQKRSGHLLRPLTIPYLAHWCVGLSCQNVDNCCSLTQGALAPDARLDVLNLYAFSVPSLHTVNLCARGGSRLRPPPRPAEEEERSDGTHLALSAAAERDGMAVRVCPLARR
jgi:hypothetical protein